MELRWQASADVSAIHAAWSISKGLQLIDAELHQCLMPATNELSRIFSANSLPQDKSWRQLLSLAADHSSNHELAERFLRRMVSGGGTPQGVSTLAAAIGNCEMQMRQRFPKLNEDLLLRAGPLQSAWEARGPGLLHLLSESTEEGFLVESATILLVQPVVGGDGAAHLQTNRIHLEAVLTDVDPRLPETLRMTWLLGQLNLDLPVYSDSIHGHTLAQVAEFALLPAVLHAAQEVELTTLDESNLQKALRLWLRYTESQASELVPILLAWWETAVEAEWPWQVSLNALSQMVK